MTRNKVAFIIVGWNNEDLLNDCFESIYAQTYDEIDIYFVDNNSADNSVKHVKDHHKNVKVIELNKNYGFAKGNNIGISQALKDENVGYVALLNTDAIVKENWTETLLAFAKDKPRFSSLQSVTLDYYNPTIIDSTHIYLNHYGQATQGSYRDHFIGIPGPMRVFGINAAAGLYSRAFIEAQPYKNLFDETMFMYLEDVDVALRATLMGWPSYIVPNTSAYHMGSASSGKNPNFSIYMTFRNNTGLLVKNMPFSLLARMLPSVIKTDYLMVRRLKEIGKPAAAKKVVRGRLVSLLYIPVFLFKRLRLIGKKQISRRHLWSLMRNGY